VKVRADFLPRKRFDAARAVIRHATFDLSRPGLFVIGRRMIFEALEQKTGKFCPVVRREFRCLFVQIEDRSAHGAYLTCTHQSTTKRRVSSSKAVEEPLRQSGACF
jgi:hypothetical protein